MSGLTRRVWSMVAGMGLLIVLAPALLRLWLAVAPAFAVVGALVIVGRLVWYFTSRY